MIIHSFEAVCKKANKQALGVIVAKSNETRADTRVITYTSRYFGRHLIPIYFSHVRVN